MNNTRYYLFFIIFFPALVIGQSQTPKVVEILKQAQELYNVTKNYTLNTHYTLYQGENSNRVEESYEGLLLKQNATFYSRIHTTEFLYFDDEYLKINHDQKRIQYGEAKQKKTLEKGISIESYLKFFKNHSLKETSTAYICTLTTTAITPLPYGKVVMYIDKKTKQITKQTLYYLEKKAFKDASGATFYGIPRLEITFSMLNKDITTYKDRLQSSSYVSIKNNKATGIGSLASYQSITL